MTLNAWDASPLNAVERSPLFVPDKEEMYAQNGGGLYAYKHDVFTFASSVATITLAANIGRRIFGFRAAAAASTAIIYEYMRTTGVQVELGSDVPPLSGNENDANVQRLSSVVSGHKGSSTRGYFHWDITDDVPPSNNHRRFAIRRYDPSTQSFSSAADLHLSSQRLGASFGRSGGFSLCGGLTAITDGTLSATSTHSKYTQASNAWTTDTIMPGSRSGHSTCSYGKDKAGVLGGSTNSYNDAAATFNTNNWQWNGTAWSAKAAMALPLWERSVWAERGKGLHVGGGLDEDGISDDDHRRYLANSDTWETKTNMPFANGGRNGGIPR